MSFYSVRQIIADWLYYSHENTELIHLTTSGHSSHHDEELGTPYDALSTHVILIIDSDEEEHSALAKALHSESINSAKYSQHTLYLKASADTASNIKKWLKMEAPEDQSTHYEEMLRLRSVIIDWDNVDEAGKCCEAVRLAYPCLAMFVVTENAVDKVQHFFTHSRLGDMPYIYSGSNRYQQTHLQMGRDMDTAIDWRYETPYWDSLKRYSSNPVISFHALPLGQSRSLSQSLTDFATFYGNRHFAAETSLSTYPLDSLLNPRSTIEHAQSKAAYAFGAEIGISTEPATYGTRFVTNGTSTANSIIISAFTKQDDEVFMERTCHISHFHALAYTHAKPNFMQTFKNAWGCTGPVSLQTISSDFKKHLLKKSHLPKLWVFTNPSFDGMFYKPARIIKAIHTVLSEYWQDNQGSRELHNLINNCVSDLPIEYSQSEQFDISEKSFIQLAFQNMIFLFDEAWSARAYFHPRLIEHTAMRAAWDLCRDTTFDYVSCLRIYATQSTHKSLSALRQGSMIHFRDPLMKYPEVRQIFEQAFRSHCTTSPSASIIASLDVARRQAQLEGALLIERCLRLAETFRKDFTLAPESRTQGFYLLNETQMFNNADPDQPDISTDECYLDPTHITLTWDMPIDGGDVRQLLLDNGIQVNKYDQYSILSIFNIGIDTASVDALRTALKNVETQIMASRTDRPLPPVKITQNQPIYSSNLKNRSMGYWLHHHSKNKARFYPLMDVLNELKQGTSSIYIAATFITPYPPGYPVIIPGQILSVEDIEYLLAIPIREIFGTQKIHGNLAIMLYRQAVED